MAIDSYSTLQTAVTNWLDRSDLTDRVPEFITLGEARIARRLRVRGVETRDTSITLTGSEYYTLPTDFLEARRIKVNSSPVRVLKYLTPTQLSTKFPSGTTGSAGYYTIIGEEIQIKPVQSGSSVLEITYFKRLPALSDSNTTNWLTANAPDLLLYGSLIEAEAYLVDDPRIPIWKGAFDESMAEWNKQEDKGRFSGSHLEARVAGGTP
jgi:hypothetical protein